MTNVIVWQGQQFIGLGLFILLIIVVLLYAYVIIPIENYFRNLKKLKETSNKLDVMDDSNSETKDKFDLT